MRTGSDATMRSSITVGSAVVGAGLWEGALEADGLGDGALVTVGLAETVGELVGASDGRTLGWTVGLSVGLCVGAVEGALVGRVVGSNVLAGVGALVGESVGGKVAVSRSPVHPGVVSFGLKHSHTALLVPLTSPVTQTPRPAQLNGQNKSGQA